MNFSKIITAISLLYSGIALHNDWHAMSLTMFGLFLWRINKGGGNV